MSEFNAYFTRSPDDEWGYNTEAVMDYEKELAEAAQAEESEREGLNLETHVHGYFFGETFDDKRFDLDMQLIQTRLMEAVEGNRELGTFVLALSVFGHDHSLLSEMRYWMLNEAKLLLETAHFFEVVDDQLAAIDARPVTPEMWRACVSGKALYYAESLHYIIENLNSYMVADVEKGLHQKDMDGFEAQMEILNEVKYFLHDFLSLILQIGAVNAKASS